MRGDRRRRLAASRGMSVLPEDPLVRWLIWVAVAVSIGAPLLAALVLAVAQ